MRIAIEVTSLLDQYSNRGIGNYTKNLVKRLVEFEEHEWHLIGFLSKKENENILGIKLNNVIFHSIGAVEPSSMLTNKRIDKKIHKALELINPDIFFVPNFEHKSWVGKWKTIVMIHDLIPVAFNSYSSKGFVANYFKGIFYKNRLKHVQKATHIITNSNYSQSEIVRLLDIPSNKITPIPLGTEKVTNRGIDSKTILRSLGISNPYLLYYGGLETNKNTEYLIEVFRHFVKQNPEFSLVIVSKDIKRKLGTSNIKSKTRQAGLLKDLIVKNKLSDKVVLPGELKNDLPTILNNANAFIHMSKSEGFGLSVLEALSHGTPTFISNIPVYKELFEGAVVFLPISDARKASQILTDSLNDSKFIKNIRNLALTKASTFSWNETAKQTLDLFNTIRFTNEMFAKTQPHKVAFVAPYFFPYKGGAETYAFSIAKRLAENGFLVEAHTSQFEKGQPRFEHKFGINIRRHYPITRGYYNRFYPGLFFSILMCNANIFHVQGFGFLWQDFCLILKKLFSFRRKKFINTPHGPFMAKNDYSNFELKIKKIITRIQKLYLNWLYDVVIAVNPMQIEWINKEYGIAVEKIKNLPIGLSEEHFEKIDFISIHSQFNPKNKILGTYLGRFHKYKGVLKIIEAIHNLPKITKSNLLFIFMGKDADALADMNKLITNFKLEDTVKIVLAPTDQRRNELLEISDFFVFPSEWEAYGIAMLEAMAHKNAIISTKTEGGKFLIRPKNGILYDLESENGLIDAMEKIITDNELRESMKIEGYKKAKSLMWHKVWGEYIELYKSISL